MTVILNDAVPLAAIVRGRFPPLMENPDVPDAIEVIVQLRMGSRFVRPVTV